MKKYVCPVCGYVYEGDELPEGFKCPHCGSSNLSVISRVCGYLGYSNVNGQSRMNDGKMAEIKNRVSM